MPDVRATLARSRETVGLALADIRARPLHMGLGAIVVGLLAGPRAPALVDRKSVV